MRIDGESLLEIRHGLCRAENGKVRDTTSVVRLGILRVDRDGLCWTVSTMLPRVITDDARLWRRSQPLGSNRAEL